MKNDVDRIEVLREILSTKEQKDISYGEAEEVGASLIAFFELLAETA